MLHIVWLLLQKKVLGTKTKMNDTPPIKCRTCKSTHVKDYEFPCRECCDFDHWKFAEKDPWPMFPLKPDPWQKKDE